MNMAIALNYFEEELIRNTEELFEPAGNTWFAYIVDFLTARVLFCQTDDTVESAPFRYEKAFDNREELYDWLMSEEAVADVLTAVKVWF